MLALTAFSATGTAGVLEKLRDKQFISGWRNEMYPVTSSFYSTPELLVSYESPYSTSTKAESTKDALPRIFARACHKSHRGTNCKVLRNMFNGEVCRSTSCCLNVLLQKPAPWLFKWKGCRPVM